MVLKNCKITGGLNADCEDILGVGGAAPHFWVLQRSSLDTQISLAQTGDIASLDFGPYGGLYRFDGQKYSHTFGDELAVTGGGNKSWTHTVTAKVLAKSTADDVTLQQLEIAQDVVIIIEDNNQNFFILGAGNGLSATAATQNSGQTSDSDTTDTVTLTGSEKTKKLRFRLPGGYQATLNYLESFEL
jgi:hypothetical protein